MNAPRPAKGNRMRILVDGDALPAPIRDILFRAAQRVRVPLVLVMNQVMRTPQSEYITCEAVPHGPDVADDRIVEKAQPGDLVVTADIPLADRVVAKGALAVNPRGTLYTEDNIKQRLATRNLMDDLRTGGMVTGGPVRLRPQRHTGLRQSIGQAVD